MATECAPGLSISCTDAARQNLFLRFTMGAAPTPGQLGELKEIITSFAAVGNNGGFARETTSPSDSSLVLTHANLTFLTQPIFQFTAQQLDIRAFQLVRHLAWRWTSTAQPILSIQVSEQISDLHPRVVRLPDATWSTELAAYPPLSRRLSIQIDREDPPDYQRARRCLVDFGRAVSNEIFDSVISRIRAWTQLMGQGAYGPPVKPAFEAEVWEESLAPYDEGSVELAFSLFEASEFAWNALLNCLEHYSLTSEPISLVTIG